MQEKAKLDEEDILPEERFAEQDDENEDENRPELDIPLKDRKLLTQPFDFIVSSLEQQIKEGSIVLQDDFQRRRVWDDRKSSRLIESLLLNVPLPVCYFAELEDGAYSVIDGQQRLTALHRYITNQFALSGLRVRPELNKKRFIELESPDQRLIRTRTIRCIVIQKESHPEIRFDVFERINSGSVKLKPQELRNSTYRGRLNKLVKTLCDEKIFQTVRGAHEIDKRMSDAELALRFFAFHYKAGSYKGYFAPFLDNYMREGMRMTEQSAEEHKRLFLDTLKKVERVFGSAAFRQIGPNGVAANQINRAIYDVIMLSFARLPEADLAAKASDIRAALQGLCQNEDFQDAIGRATRDKGRIQTRLDLWLGALAGMGLHCPNIKIGQ